MKRLSIFFFLIALLIAGVTIAAFVVRANAPLAAHTAASSPSAVTSLSVN